VSDENGGFGRCLDMRWFLGGGYYPGSRPFLYRSVNEFAAVELTCLITVSTRLVLITVSTRLALITVSTRLAHLATSICPLWPLLFLVILIGAWAAVWHCSCFRFRGVPLGPPNGYAGCQMPGPRPNRRC
jgi:hypothetical protein